MVSRGLVVKSFDWFSTWTYADNSSIWRRLTSTLHNLPKKSVFVSYMDVFLVDS